MEMGPKLPEMKEKTVSNSQPSWLLISLADLEERMKMLAISTAENDEIGDTFAERAESYYRKRPQLLALLQDLYKGYISLSDRYVLTLAKQNHHHHCWHSSQVSTTEQDSFDFEDASGVTQFDSDMESSLSYQQPSMLLPSRALLDGNAIVAEFVIKNVEYDFLLHDISLMERQQGESLRKMELQKSLLEVLESERLILLNENASLGCRLSSLVEENKELASESLFMKRKAGELARCVLKMREDHRVYMLNRKIEDLQAQIYRLEKRNKECYEQLVKQDNQEESKAKTKGKGRGRGKDYDELCLEVCFQMGSLIPRWESRNATDRKFGKGKKVSGWWKRAWKNMDLILCGSISTRT